MPKLRNRKALLTGASRGLGVFIAKEIASRGGDLILTARSEERLQEVAASLQPFGVDVIVVPADISDERQREDLVASAIQAFGRIDVLVNNAGVEHVGHYVEQPWPSMRQMLEVNLAAPMHLTQLVLRDMIARRDGHIVNISSVGGKVGAPYDAVYCGTKAGIAEWARGLRIELSESGVRFSTVFPGYVTQVGMFSRFGVKPHKMIGSCTPAQVSRAVADAIEDERVEVLVNSLPLRAWFMLAELSPRLVDRLMHRLGVVEFQRGKFS